MRILTAWTISVTATAAQLLPQCDPTTNGTTYNGQGGSELQLNSTTIRKIDAQDAHQGVAVDPDHFYSIDNFSITKHNKTTGEALLQWYGGQDGPIIHLDGGVVFGDILYAPHSNYPQSPITSSVEMWNTTTMQHISSHPLGIYRGSLTWIDQDPATQTWYGTFANYD